MIERWLTNFGQEETLKLLEHSQSTPPLTIRTCEIAITPEGLLEMLERKGLRVRYGELVKSCLVLDRGRTSADNDGERKSSPCSKVQEPFMKSSKTASAFRGSPTKLAGYDEGLFSVQDEAAAFVSFVLDPKPGELVIDLCAAPGGKTVHAAEIMQNKGRVIAVDQSASRLSHLKSSRTRLGLKNIEIVVHDGRTFKCDMLADRVLVDAPCTGTGVINRLSDLRFKKKPEDLISLTQLQRELLANAVSLLKPGGVLVYSTCSIEPEENFANAQWFLDNFPDFEPDDISSFIPQWIMQECFPTIQGPLCKTKKEDSCLHMIQLLPPRHKVSGFFVARFRKKTN
jgi:16S rRNA (cytosine967-C5)-methyltransferase